MVSGVNPIGVDEGDPPRSLRHVERADSPQTEGQSGQEMWTTQTSSCHIQLSQADFSEFSRMNV
jgi:hypothetical protein